MDHFIKNSTEQGVFLSRFAIYRKEWPCLDGPYFNRTMSSPATKFCEAREKGNDRKVNDRNPSLARSIFPAPRAAEERGGPRKQAASFPHRFASSPPSGFRSFLPSTEMSRQKHSPRYDPELTPSGSSTSRKNSDHPGFSWETWEPSWVIDKLLTITLSDFDGLCAVGGKCFQYC
ncbi:hypothetical protein CEXT_474041 [Caerostris extrusa]|uniref:Uncharacterized protein n=1 Tax=Caerostris extrusa TaxID=172846 RepID=A0AAV4WEK5_CAEEX|nr:hypothetical protein CEXT_474041 [Caerostris extrusa]